MPGDPFWYLLPYLIMKSGIKIIVKLPAYMAGLPGAQLFFSDTCLTSLTKRGLRGMKPVKA
jgi:hypothetical protein